MRSCTWCKRPVVSRRRDATTCSKACRQAQWRFRTAVGRDRSQAGSPRRIGYADPPYPGKARKYYGDHPDFGGEVDHAELVASLAADFDTWALSTSASALPDVLALCPPGVRVAAWVKGARARRRVLRPLNSWEPVIYFGARVAEDLHDGSLRPDSLVLGVTARRTDPAHVTGAKPAGFARWLFELLGAQSGDDFVDLFPGSGGVGRAWVAFAGARDVSCVATSDQSTDQETDEESAALVDRNLRAMGSEGLQSTGQEADR